MQKKILVVSMFAVALLTLVSFSSAVGYNVVKNTQEEIIKDEYEEYTPLALVLQLISKLNNYNDIETENDVLQIIESDAELSDIIENLESFNCGCEDEKTLDGDYFFICWYLWFIGIIGAFILLVWDIPFIFDYIWDLGEYYNCW